VVAIRLQTPLGSAPVVPTARNLPTFLEHHAEHLAGEWRKRYYANDTSLTTVAQLDGVVELLIVEIGRSLEMPTDLPATAWGRTGGVLRLSQERGAPGLHLEFCLLRAVLEGAANIGNPPHEQRKRLRTLIDAAEAQALALLARTQDSNAGKAYPSVHFQGVVVETQ
jgi:hypothetical protein